MKPLFPLGQTAATPGALNALRDLGLPPTVLLSRHVVGDWGDVDADDWRANDDALKNGERIFSAYVISGVKFWVITEADRSSTTLLLPEDY
jgi:hypothetical protein